MEDLSVIGDVIKKYRHELGLTQEEMANRLGVTTPAVNKWENNNTQPDIGLLAPIARLLGITTDTLLSFREDLTDEEISVFVKVLDKKAETTPYDDLFAEGAGKIKEYPNCEKLKWNVATMLDAWRLAYQVPNSEKYDIQIHEWYSQVLDSEDPAIRKSAAESLYGFYYRKEDYDKAESYLSYLPLDDPDRKSRYADILNKNGRTEEAFREQEELLLKYVNRLRITLNALYVMYMEQGNTNMARKLLDKQSSLASIFEMGKYQVAAPALDLAVYEKDVEATEQIMRTLIENSDTISDFAKSDLFAHISFQIPESSFSEKIRLNIIEGFRDEDTYGYMCGNEYWEKWNHATAVHSPGAKPC